MHAPGLQWRGATSAPFPGYMLIGRGQDFATTLTSASGDIIDQYVERLCQGSDERYLYKGQCRADGALQRGNAQRRPGQVPDHGARAGGGVRDRQRAEGGDLVQALELRQGRARSDLLPPALQRAGTQPEHLLPGGGEDSADLQLVLHRQPARRDVHERQAAHPAAQRRSRPADPGHGAVRVAGLPVRRQAHPGRGSARRDDDQLEQHLRPRLRRLGRQLGRQRLGRSGGPPGLQPAASEGQRRQVDAAGGHRGDERRRDPGRAGDRHRAAAAAPAPGLAGPQPADGEDAVAAGRLAAATAAAAWIGISTARSTTRARRSWTRPGRGSPTRS